MRRLILLLIFLLSVVAAQAQALSDKFYEENPQGLFEELLDLSADTTLYYRSTSRQPIFERLVRYGVSHVTYSRRGEVSDSEVMRLGAHSLSSPLDEWTDYNLLSLLRRVPTSGGLDLYTTQTLHGADLRGEWFNPAPSFLRKSNSIKLNYAERNYRLGVGYSSVGHLRSGWHYSLAVGARGGRDAHIEGLFSNQAHLWVAAERSAGRWQSVYGDMCGRLVVAFGLAPMERSVRSWNTEEVFSLAADRLYNSSWGYQQGRVRASNVRREVVPVLYGEWSLEDEFGIVGASVSAMVKAGRKSRLGLDWNDAASPLPDWYGYLPSGYDDPTLALEAEGVWRRRDSSYTQIGWDRLYDINRLSPRGAVYAMMDDITDILSAEVNISGGEGGRRRLDGKVVMVEGLFGGLTVGYHTHRLHNKQHDLLGGEYLSTGFDMHDYVVECFESELYESWSASGDYGTISVGGSLGNKLLHYHNSLTGGDIRLRSLSDAMLKTTWNYRIGANLALGASLHGSLRTPHHSRIIASPKECATINPYARAEENYGVDLRGEWRKGKVKLSASLWANYTQGESRVESFWSDIDGTSSALLAGEMKNLRMGVEADAGWYPSSEWSVEGALSVGSWRYVADGVADIVDSTTGKVIVRQTPLRLKGLYSHSSPMVLAVVKATWRPRGGWMVSLEGALAAGRRMEPSLLFCSDYLLKRNLSPEEHTSLTAQPSLGTAPNLSATIYRRVGDVGVSLSVRNLLGGCVKYDGYQPSRLFVTEKEYAMGYEPHPSKFQYSYPRNATITISYDF